MNILQDYDFPCPHCGALNDPNRGMFCRRCGKALLNFCTNEDCENSSPSFCGDIMPDDLYCPLCGAPASFLEKGYEFDDSHSPQNEQ